MRKDENRSFKIDIFLEIVIGIIIFALLIVIVSKMVYEKKERDDIAQFASIGELYSQIDEIGNEGINSIGEYAKTSSIVVEETETTDSLKEQVEEITEDPYTIPATTTDVMTKDTEAEPETEPEPEPEVEPKTEPVVYQVINLIDEPVDMNQVDVSNEESRDKEIDKGDILVDTIKFVESTATPIENEDCFVKINKADIKDPQTLAYANDFGGFRTVSGTLEDDIVLSGNTETDIDENTDIIADVNPDDESGDSENDDVPVEEKKDSDETITTEEDEESSVEDDITAEPLKLSLLGDENEELDFSLTLFKGDTYQISAVVEGYLEDNGVVFTSSNNAVSVTEDGLLTAVTEGTSDITVMTNEKDSSGNRLIKQISVMVKNDVTKDTETSLKYTKDTKDYQVYYKEEDGDYCEAKWADYYKYEEFYIKGETEYIYTGWQTINEKVYYYSEDGNKVKGEQIIGGVKYNFASDGSLSKDSGIRGIDVSVYQGNIDWKAVKNSGISFVIIRVGFRGYTQGGLYLDSNCKSNIQCASAAGLKVGLYVFSQAVNETEAVEEASYCVNIARDYRITYPIYIDSEYSNNNHNGRADGLDKKTRTSVCKAFCETVKSAGYTPGVYASKSWFYNQLDAGQLSAYKIWLAHYCGQTDYRGKYDMWQHSSTGSVNGISGNVDLDISYIGY